MQCLEFKKLALADPGTRQENFIEHSKACPECLKYVAEIKQMDADLRESLSIAVPPELMAKLQLNQVMLETDNHQNSTKRIRRFAMAASVAVALFVGGIMLVNQINLSEEISDDYQSLLAGVMSHVSEQPITPVWDNPRANRVTNTLLASYDDGMRIKQMDNLQFGRICPMGEYKGLHATLETSDGQITFAYIKGKPLGDMIDSSFEGYLTRVKPVRGGNLVIFSRSKKSLDEADRDLEKAIYWDI